VKVATVSPLLKLTVPATLAPLESFKLNDTLLGTTASENVTVGNTDTETPVDPEAGVTPVTVGAGNVTVCENTTSTQ
jgi:hypothetical protein